MRNRERNRVDAVADIREDMIAMLATLGGEFDSRIKQLQDLRKEIKARQAVELTLKQAEDIKTSAVKEAEQIRMQARDTLLDAQKRAAELEDKATQVTRLHREAVEKEKSVAEREAKLTAMREEWDKIKADAIENITARSKTIEQREAQLDKEIRETAETRRKLDERLKALGSVA